MVSQSLLGEEVYPKRSTAESGGYRMTARLVKTSRRFIIGFAQDEDALGTLSLRGPGISITVGSRIPLIRSFPFFEEMLVNLSGGGERDARSELVSAIERKHNRRPDYKLLASLASQVLAPY